MAGPMRQQIDVAKLEGYIAKTVPEIKLPLDIKQFGFGQSNPTYQLTDAKGNKFVMRKKPPGKLVSVTAHKVEREYRVLKALDETEVPTPKVFCLCEDSSVVGTPFYIMDFVDGRIFEDATIPDVDPETRTIMWKAAVEALAKLHKVDYKAVGLNTYGKSEGFYHRQIATFRTLNEAQGSTVDIETKQPVGPISRIEEMFDFFANNMPKDRACIIHGDYKIDNMIYHKTEPRVIAILDWEMGTIGHPLSDLAIITMPYLLATHPQEKYQEDFLPGRVEGLPTKNQILEWYTQEAGWDPRPDMDFAHAFSVMRSTIVFQGIAARYAVRQASSASALKHALYFPEYQKLSWGYVKRLMAKTQKKPKL